MSAQTLPQLIVPGFENCPLHLQAILLFDSILTGWTPVAPPFGSQERRMQTIQALLAWVQIVHLRARSETHPHMFFYQDSSPLVCANCELLWDGNGPMPAGPCIVRT